MALHPARDESLRTAHVPARVFVQARMSSRRFPGKVLAPFRGRPVLAHVLDAVARGLPDVPVVVATSREESDAPLAAWLASVGVACFRGALDDVLGRFRACLDEHPCGVVVRVCADSPLLAPHVLGSVLRRALEDDDFDLVTTTQPRTFPVGWNVEALRAATLRTLDAEVTDPGDREHVTSHIHRNAARYRVRNIHSSDPALARLRLAVDTLEDLARLEALDGSVLSALASGPIRVARG